MSRVTVIGLRALSTEFSGLVAWERRACKISWFLESKKTNCETKGVLIHKTDYPKEDDHTKRDPTYLEGRPPSVQKDTDQHMRTEKEIFKGIMENISKTRLRPGAPPISNSSQAIGPSTQQSPVSVADSNSRYTEH